MLSATFTYDGPGARLDALVAKRFGQLSKSCVRRGIMSGAATVNGRVPAKGEYCRAGDVIALINFPEPSDYAPQPDDAMPLDVVHEDDALLAFNKPAGIHCLPNAPGERGTLANAALTRWPRLDGIGDPRMCGILHRIDVGTSGLVLAAKTQEAYNALRAQFKARQIRKTYLAVVRGDVRAPATLRHEIGHNPGKPGHMVDVKKMWNARHPMKAETSYRPLRALGADADFEAPATLLEVVIFTGVTHQIRCQLALAGFPVWGDDRYGPQGARGKGETPRYFLHALSAQFTHPATGRDITLAAPSPGYFPVL